MEPALEILVLAAGLNIVSFIVALYISMRVYRVYRLIGDQYLLIVSLGFLVLALGSVLTVITSFYALFVETGSTVFFNSSHGGSQTPLHTPPHGMHDMHGRGWHPWIHGSSSFSGMLISYSSPLYTIAYMLILAGLLGETRAWSSREVAIIPIATMVMLVSDLFSIGILTVITIHCMVGKRFTVGSLGYLLFLLAHIIRIMGTLVFSPTLFVLGELLRPLGLVVIAVGVGVYGKGE
ncbi:MAG: hypothetical protein J7K21_01570 [Desulfurococcales archaeon]|nr:hypothetical protein [Desulfurococcales archaeon]